MHKIMFVFVAAISMFAFTGCKKAGKGGGDALAKMEGFQKAMCECKDKACADKVQEDMTKWGTEAAKTATKDEKPDPELVKKSGEIMTKYTDCMTKLMTAAAPPAEPPPAEPPAAGSAEPAAGSAEPAPAAADPKADDKKTDDKKTDAKKDDKAGGKKEGGW